MNTFFLPLLQAAENGSGPKGLDLTSFLPFVIIIAIFYFLIIRPQNKKRKETEKMLSALKKGDKIVTIGGLYGTIQSVKESTVIVKVDDNVKLEFSRSSISSVIASKEDKSEEKSGTEEQSSEDGE
jgi:preprotein translocase subunit YajC